MKKISEHRAGFFKRMLSMLIIIVVAVSNLGAGSIAAEPGTGETNPAAANEPVEAAPAEPETKPAEEPAAEPAAQPVGRSAEGSVNSTEIESTDIDFTGYQDKSLDIYNYLWYTNAGGGFEQSVGSYKIWGSNIGTDEQPGGQIIIGNHPVAAGYENSMSPMKEDIPVSLAGLTMTEGITIKPAGEEFKEKNIDNNTDKIVGASNTVVLTVSEASSLGNLVVEDGAGLRLILDANLDVGNITLGENSRIEVEVRDDNKLTVSGAFSSRGTVALNGGTIEVKQGLSAANLSLSTTTVNADGYDITATDTLSMTDSKVENASLFGYAAENGVKTLTFGGAANNQFSNVKAVGCKKDSAIRLSVVGIENVAASGDAVFYCDYSITYQQPDGSVIAPEADWPEAFRVSTANRDFNSGEICGFHTASQYIDIDGKGEITLPEIQKSGYTYEGWKLNGSEEPVTSITAVAGNVTLSAVLMEGDTVKRNRSYKPDKYKNGVDGNRKSARANNVTLELSKPMPGDWSLTYKDADNSDAETIIKAGDSARTISVKQGSMVTLTTSNGKEEDISFWDFSKEGNDGKITPELQSVQEDGLKLIYEFEMPTENVTATYDKDDKEFTLEKDDTVNDAWTIFYNKDGNNVELDDAEVKLKCGSSSSVTLELKNVSQPLALTLTFRDGNGRVVRTKSLEDYATKNSDSKYTFDMPAKNVTVSSVWELYLDDGTIELSPTGFKQVPKYGTDSAPIAWSGDYRIWQCEDNNTDFHETGNVLSLSDNLTGRNISLGNLNITTGNSISLGDNASANLTQEGMVQAKNILVPAGCTLSLEGKVKDNEKPTLTLAPAPGTVAIGGSEGGIIKLESLDISITPPNGSTSNALDGKEVTVTDSTLDTNGSPLHGGNKLVIKNSSVTQH